MHPSLKLQYKLNEGLEYKQKNPTGGNWKNSVHKNTSFAGSLIHTIEAKLVYMVLLALEFLGKMFSRRALVFNWTSQGRIEVEAFFCKTVRERVSTLLSREEKHILPCSHSSSADRKLIKSQKIIESRIPKIPQLHSALEEPILEVDDVALRRAQR